MNSPSSTLDCSLGSNLNLSLCDGKFLRLESRGPSNDTVLCQDQTKNKEKQIGDLEEQLNRMSTENKKLTQMLTSMCENYNVLQSQVINLLNQTPKNENGNESSKKRKACFKAIDCEEIQGNLEHSCISYEDSCKRARQLNCKPRVSRILIRTKKSDLKLGVDDGYYWRKYGQKVTKDNPSPRAYFKCANAPLCPVKKKVQRSADDPSFLVATYEGEHNHENPSSKDTGHVVLASSDTLNHYSISKPNTSMISHELMGSPNLSNNNMEDDRKEGIDVERKPLQRSLVEKMAASLTRDPSFTSALAAAISGKMLDDPRPKRWL